MKVYGIEMPMKSLPFISLILNLIIIAYEILTLSKIRKKINIIKYYTFLQNFLALVISIIFCIYLISTIFLGNPMVQAIRGLRYIATCGLIVTMFIYNVFLSSNDKNLLNEEDFILDFNPKKANFILHYLCPLISLISFVIFERQIILTDSAWTGYAAIPSCLYWIIYIILSATNLWEEPYDFTTSKAKKKNILLETLIIMFIPLSLIIISYILWIIK